MTTATRERRHSGFALLRFGFRPFFLGAGIWAVLAMAVRVGDFAGLPSDGFLFQDPTRWHAHAFLFGYASAVVAGFALTAVPNWTGRLPIAGMPLLALAGLWLAGRVATLATIVSAPVAATIDAAFLPVLAAVLAREVIAARNLRNLPVCGLILLLGTANLLFHLESFAVIAADGYGTRLGIAVLVMLIGLIGGRIVPSFTSNWLARQGIARVAPADTSFERLTHGLSGAALILWILIPFSAATGAACLAAFAAHAVRFTRWRGWETWPEPLVLILHVGYSWIPIGFALTGLAIVVDPSWSSAGLHAFAAGAVGTMTLAVMTRATLGHTGRALQADAGTVALYLCVTASALLRIAAVFIAEWSGSLLIAAGASWILAFVAFVAIYGPMHLTPRLTHAV